MMLTLAALAYRWERFSFVLSGNLNKMQLQEEQLIKSRRGTVLIGLIALAAMGIHPAFGQLTENEQKASVGDAPTDPGPLANDLSGALAPGSIQSAMRKVAQWQNVRIVDTPSQDWTFATLYVGMLSASATLKDDRYRDTVLKVAGHYHWALGPRKTHADDQAIGQAYLWLYRQKKEAERIAPLTVQ